MCYAKYKGTLMSKSNDMSSSKAKGYVFWSWRDGGMNACVRGERSPSRRPVEHRVSSDVPPDDTHVPDNPGDISFSRTHNKREDTCTKMGEREMVRQVGMNPFIQTDYVKGIEIRDKFLVPFHESKPSYDQGV